MKLGKIGVITTAVLGLFLLPWGNEQRKKFVHLSLPLEMEDASIIPTQWRDLDISNLGEWDYIVRIFEDPSFERSMITDVFYRDGMRRIQVRRMGGDPFDVNFIVEENFEKSGKKWEVPDWLLNINEVSNSRGFDGTTFTIQVIAHGVKRKIVRWSPEIRPEDPDTSKLVYFMESIRKRTGIHPRGGSGRVLLPE